jgi:hypothetical protein
MRTGPDRRSLPAAPPDLDVRDRAGLDTVVRRGASTTLFRSRRPQVYGGGIVDGERIRLCIEGAALLWACGRGSARRFS